MLDFIGAKEDGVGADNRSYTRKFQSNHHHQQTNTQLFTHRMPFLSNNVRALKGDFMYTDIYCELNLT